MTQARRVLSSSETGWSSEERREIETLINDIEQLRDVVCTAGSRCLLFVVTYTNVINACQICVAFRPMQPLVAVNNRCYPFPGRMA